MVFKGVQLTFKLFQCVHRRSKVFQGVPRLFKVFQWHYKSFPGIYR